MVISKSERSILIIALLLIAAVSLPGRCQGEEGGGEGGRDDASKGDSDADDDDDDDYDYDPGTDTNCHPSEADTCFDDVNENLLCHLLSPRGRDCEQRTAKDLCMGLVDALNCTSDIVDTSCSEAEGRLLFDNWLAGLRGVYTHLCKQKDYSLVSNLLTSDSCWNFRTFLRCVENKANLTHINNLLTTELDQYECNLLQMAVSICNDKAEKGRVKCRGKANAVNEALAAFFSSSLCAGATLTICNVPNPQERKGDARSSLSSSSSMGIAITMTLLVTVAVIGVITLILSKRSVITLNTRFKMMRGGGRGGDDDEGGSQEIREDYGRFL